MPTTVEWDADDYGDTEFLALVDAVEGVLKRTPGCRGPYV
jgi:hypothetical protein